MVKKQAINRREGITWKKRFWFNLSLICLVLLAIQLYVDNNVIEVSNYEVSFENLPKEFDETVLLHVSDLHSKLFGTDNEQLYEKIEEINPDYIMLTGDMVNASDTDFSVFYDFAEKVGAKYETYYIVGNHELALSQNDLADIITTITGFGVKVLDNETITLVRNGETINLHGMWYNSRYYFNEEFTIEVMNKIIGEENGGFDILLTHNPKSFEVYADWGAEVILTGHVHGGMVRLPYFGAIFSPERTLFPKYSEGVYSVENSHMVVSRGLGRGLTGFRLFNKPELAVIVLNSK